MIRKSSTGWQMPSMLSRVRRNSVYQISIPINYTHSRVGNMSELWKLVLEEVISGIEVFRKEIWRHVRILHTMSMIWWFPSFLVPAWLLLGTLLSRDINFWIFLSPVTCCQLKIHLFDVPRTQNASQQTIYDQEEDSSNSSWSTRIIHAFTFINRHTTTGLA